MFVFSISGGWEFEMQASKIEKDANNVKAQYVLVAFLNNVQVMLERFKGLYELKNSSLQEVFLRPCSQFNDECDPTANEYAKEEKVSGWFTI